MRLDELLIRQAIDPRKVIVLRHRPFERELRKVLPWLAQERPDVFNAYQQTQGARIEKTMKGLEGSGFVASFIGHEPGKALFVGLYNIASSKALSLQEYWEVPAYQQLKTFGMKGFTEQDGRSHILWFDLQPNDVYTHWKGKLIISWPPPEIAWWRRLHRNGMPVHAILEESLLEPTVPDWNWINLSWEELGLLPGRWRNALSQWRGIYLIFDGSDGMAYVGSAYGRENLLGRWREYASSGHGGNKLLRVRNPTHFRFTILQRVSPDMEPDEVIRLEASWKERLHTRAPFGLNEN